LSRNNSDKVRINCEICGKDSDEIHHISPQKDANSDGYIGHVHKNHIANLLSICESCHDKIHSKETTMKRYKTSKGTMLLDSEMNPLNIHI
jgi:DNA mismatch repair protein MutS